MAALDRYAKLFTIPFFHIKQSQFLVANAMLF